jgi:hypothetical protein
MDAGDVGAFSTANIEFESIPGDVITVYGANSPEAAEAAANHNQAVADFEGISIHCAQNSPLCAAAGGNAKPDLLPDEPGGYTGFNAIFGNKYIQPVINPSDPILDLDGNVIANVASNGTFLASPASIRRRRSRLVTWRGSWRPACQSSISTLPTSATISMARR